MTRLIHDTDPGVDDALAILLALRNKRANLEMITTVGGNVPVNIAYENASRIVEMATNEPVPVYRGLERPVVRKLSSERKSGSREKIGTLGSRSSPSNKEFSNAVEAIISKIMNNRNEITLVATAPLTNIAEAMKREPKLPDNIKRAVIMGGAIERSGNITPAAEFNMYVDPEAANAVLSSGMPITLVTLDLTMKVMLTPEHLEQIKKSGTLIGDYVEKIVKPYLDRFTAIRGFDGCPIHDPLAMAVAIDDSIVETKPILVDVETGGNFSRGQTIADLRLESRDEREKSPVSYCTGVDRDKFFEMFLEVFH